MVKIYTHKLTNESFDGNINRWSFTERPLINNAIVIEIPPRLCSISCVTTYYIITEHRCIKIHKYGSSHTKIGDKYVDEIVERCKREWEGYETQLTIDELKKIIQEGTYNGRELYEKLKNLGIKISTLYYCYDMDVFVTHL